MTQPNARTARTFALAAALTLAPLAAAQQANFFEGFDGSFENVWNDFPFSPTATYEPPMVDWIGLPNGIFRTFAGEQVYRLTNDLSGLGFVGIAADYVLNDPAGKIIEARVFVPGTFGVEPAGAVHIRVMSPGGDNFRLGLTKGGVNGQIRILQYGDTVTGNAFIVNTPFIDGVWYRMRIDNSRPGFTRLQLLDGLGMAVGEAIYSTTLQDLQITGSALYITINQHGFGAPAGSTADVCLDYLEVKDGCPADLTAPWDVLDQSDIDLFIQFYLAGNSTVDVAAPIGVLDNADVDAFIASYLAGCP